MSAEVFPASVRYHVRIFATPSSEGDPERFLQTYDDHHKKKHVYVQDDLQALSVRKTFGAGASSGSPTPMGTWSITLNARRDVEKGWGWGDIIKPMDYIEIRLSGDRKAKQDKIPPLLMRGFVDQIRETREISGDKPQLSVTVSGRDYTKLLLTKQIFMGQNYFAKRYSEFVSKFISGNTGGNSTDGDTTSSIPGLVSYAPAKDYLDAIIPALLSFEMADLHDLNPYAPKTFRTLCNIPSSMVINRPYDLTAMSENRTLWSFLDYFQSKPFSEIYVADTEEDVWLVWRLAPLLTTKGKSVWIEDDESLIPGLRRQDIQNVIPVNKIPKDDPALPYYVEISLREVISMDYGPSDSDQFTFFFCWPELPGEQGTEQAQMGAFSATTDPNVRGNPFPSEEAVDKDPLIQRYGFRPLMRPVTLLPFNPGGSSSTDAEQKTEQFASISAFNRVMTRMFGNSLVFRSGNITVVGNENIRPGCYLRIKESQAYAYVEEVTHQIPQIWGKAPFYTTSCVLSRGIDALGII